MLANKLMSALSGGAVDKLYVDDVFSTYLYTGNGSTQTINNGIDLAGEGGLVWLKDRSSSANHQLFDTLRGVTRSLITDSTTAEKVNAAYLTAFSRTGFSLGGDYDVNKPSDSYASWTFRRAPKFFDVVTYTGDNTSNRQIPHSLGVAPGMVVIKKISKTGDWFVWHRGLTDENNIYLNKADAQESYRAINPAAQQTSAYITLGTQNLGLTNGVGATYVAYLFAHDPSEDGIIQCGSFTTDASGNATVNLGWEPQWMLYRMPNTPNNWGIIDTMRGWLGGAVSETNSKVSLLNANLVNIEAVSDGYVPIVNQTGFEYKNSYTPNTTIIYLAIRRPNKPPKTGAEVYNATAGTYSQPQSITVGFPYDLAMLSRRSGAAHYFVDRLRGGNSYLYSTSTNADATSLNPYSAIDQQNSTTIANIFGGVYSGINHFFRRAPGFFDVVCYTGTGAARTVAHNLGVAPELMIVKCRTPVSLTDTGWYCYHSALGAGQVVPLNMAVAALANQALFNNTKPTTSVFSVAGSNGFSSTSSTYVAYLFASLPGISKVGSYTGNGSNQTIDCGFTTGARFILIKRTDSTGDWYVWDTARGIVAANDPHLSLNTTAAEVTTDDSVDPHASGFIVNQVAATNINVSSGQYIFLAIA